MKNLFLAFLICLGLSVTPQSSAVTQLHPTKLTLLSAFKSLASPIGKVKIPSRRVGKTFPTAFSNSGDGYIWKVNAPKAEKYLVVALIEAKIGDKYLIKSKKGTVEYIPKEEGWARYEFGYIDLPAGKSEIKFIGSEISGRTRFKSIELLREGAVSDYKARVKAFKESAKPNHFDKDDIYGVMHHYGKWSVTPEGKSVEWPKGYESLDIEKFADRTQEMGASFVLLTLTWAEYYIAAPIKSIEEILPGRTTLKYGGKDYIMEIADALNKRGIKLFLYYHVGHGDSEWWTRAASGSNEKALENWKKIIGEMGERYGKKLAGWWFDDGMAYYPADFEELSAVARKGNPERLVTYNNWTVASYTDFIDYMSGENHRGFSTDEIKNGVIAHGKDKGQIPFGLWRTENHWAAYQKAPIIKTKGFDGGRFALQALEGGYTICFNLMMFSDGTLNPLSIESVKKAKKALEEKGLNRKFEPINQ